MINTQMFSKKVRTIVLAVLAAVVIALITAVGWHKHQNDKTIARQQIDLGVVSSQTLPVAFLTEYSLLQGNADQQKDLVAKYGTSSLINKYQPVKKGANDPLLCSSKTLSAVSLVNSRASKADTVNTLTLRYKDGSQALVDTQVNSQVNGLKLDSVTCGPKPTTKTETRSLGPNLPVETVSP